MKSVDFEIAGRPFHALTAGDPARPLLLFLHGFPEYSGAWGDMLTRFAGDWYCVAPDQRGYGGSWRPPEVEHYAIAELAGDALAMIDRFGGGRAAAVIGHDWGASVAYVLAMRAADKVDRLVVLNGVHPVPFQTALAKGGAQSRASQYILKLRAEGSEDRLAADGFALMLKLFSADMDLSWMIPEKRVQYEAAWRDAAGVCAMVNWYRASPIAVAAPGEPISNDDLPQWKPEYLRIAMPHLLIWGLNDTALLPECRDGLEDFCDHLEVEEVAGADHWIVHQRPDEVAARIRAFLAAT